MPFPYYDSLSPADRRIYRKSDAIVEVPLEAPDPLRDLVDRVRLALEEADRKRVQKTVEDLVAGLVDALSAPPVRIRVLSKRPSHDWGELQGLYEPEEDGETALITVWMRTAAKQKVVAFKTFLRTVLHELCHHFDYEVFELEDSFHTEGFFKRESHLFHQIAGERPQAEALDLFD